MIIQESEFHKVADEFVNLADELGEERETTFLSAAFLHAVARYNTVFFYKNDGSLEGHSTAIDYYCEQYKKMLLECMHDFSS